MKKWTTLLLGICLLTTPYFASAQQKQHNITNSIYFGGEYLFLAVPSGFSGSGYIEVETSFGNPYVSLLNTFGAGYTRIEDIPIFRPREPDTNAVNIYYSIGGGVPLGMGAQFRAGLQLKR